MRRRAEILESSRLDASPEAVWERVMSADGINFEMAPVFRMTVPRGLDDLDLSTVEPGRLGRSWILLFGLLPVDYDDLGIERIEQGRGFLERSTMLSQRLWEHERTIEPLAGGGCTVTDRVAWEPRLPFPGRLLRPLFGAFFRHRHRRLRRQFAPGGGAVALNG
jgi:ligand-binding SRPBCC domain-containing protein